MLNRNLNFSCNYKKFKKHKAFGQDSHCKSLYYSFSFCPVFLLCDSVLSIQKNISMQYIGLDGFVFFTVFL